MNSYSISDFSPMIEMTEFTVAQGIDIPLTSQDTATVTAVASTRNGRGTGSLTTSFRRVLADLSWFRVCTSLTSVHSFFYDKNSRLI